MYILRNGDTWRKIIVGFIFSKRWGIAQHFLEIKMVE